MGKDGMRNQMCHRHFKKSIIVEKSPFTAMLQVSENAAVQKSLGITSKVRYRLALC